MPAWVATPPNASSTVRFFDSSPFSPSVRVRLPAGLTTGHLLENHPLPRSQGRYLALTRFAPGAEGAPMRFGDAPSAVVLVELATGAETALATTRGADSQLGAQVQWGRSDAELYFNDVAVSDAGRARAVGVRLELSLEAAGGAPPRIARRDELECTVYSLAPRGARLALSPCLRRMRRTQLGYGVHVPDADVPANADAPTDDGLCVCSRPLSDSREPS